MQTHKQMSNFLDYAFPLTFSHKYTRWSYLPPLFVDCD